MNRRTGRFFLVAAIVLLSGCGNAKYQNTKVVIDEVYRLEGADNMKFAFSKDSTLVVRQKGIYVLEEDESGNSMVRICLDDTSRELPEDYNYTDYLLEDKGRYVELTFTTDEFALDANPMLLFPLKGTDGLLSGLYFNGTYQIGSEGDSYQYIFKEDGQVTMQIKQHYYADGKIMKLSDHAGETEYLYELSEDELILKNKEEKPILSLLKETEEDEK